MGRPRLDGRRRDVVRALREPRWIEEGLGRRVDFENWVAHCRMRNGEWRNEPTGEGSLPGLDYLWRLVENRLWYRPRTDT